MGENYNLLYPSTYSIVHIINSHFQLGCEVLQLDFKFALWISEKFSCNLVHRSPSFLAKNSSFYHLPVEYDEFWRAANKFSNFSVIGFTLKKNTAIE